MKNYYYALSDSFTGDNPAQATSGFANTSEVLAFKSKAERDVWVSLTYLLKARVLLKPEAIRITAWKDAPENYGLSKMFQKVKPARIYGEEDSYVALKYMD